MLSLIRFVCIHISWRLININAIIEYSKLYYQEKRYAECTRWATHKQHNILHSLNQLINSIIEIRIPELLLYRQQWANADAFHDQICMHTHMKKMNQELCNYRIKQMIYPKRAMSMLRTHIKTPHSSFSKKLIESQHHLNYRSRLSSLYR